MPTAKIVPNLWFDTQAAEAAQFYTSLFKNSRITATTHYSEGSLMPAGTVLTVSFELDGQPFVALNGGPQFPFTEAVSLAVNCDDQAEIDRLWDVLTADGGQESVCGWLKDKYGLSWQIVPSDWDTRFPESPENAHKIQALMDALYQMKKIDVKALEDAYNQA